MRKIRTDELEHIFESRGVRAECEFCGNSNWMVNGNLGGVFMWSINKNDLSQIKHGAVVIECCNCGNLKMFSRRLLGG